MVKFAQLPVRTEFMYANFFYVKLTEFTSLSLQGHGLIELQADDDVITSEDTDGESQTYTE